MVHIPKTAGHLPLDNDSASAGSSLAATSPDRLVTASVPSPHASPPRTGTPPQGLRSNADQRHAMDVSAGVSASDASTDTSEFNSQTAQTRMSPERITRRLSPAVSTSSSRSQSPSAFDNPALRHLRPARTRAQASEAAGSSNDVPRRSLVPIEEDRSTPIAVPLPRTLSLVGGRPFFTENDIKNWAHEVAQKTGGPIPIDAVVELLEVMQAQSGAAPVPAVSVSPPPQAPARQRRSRSISENAYPFGASPPRSNTSAVSNRTSGSGGSTQTGPFERLQRERRRRAISGPDAISPPQLTVSGQTHAIPQLALKPGTTMEPAGRGGAASVFSVTLAQDLIVGEKNLGNKFAFKALHGAARIEELQKEIDASMKVKDLPNMMQVYGLAEIGGKTGILAEYIDGKASNALFSTARRAVETGKISTEEFFGVVRHSFSDLLLGLAAMNDRQIGHNDISSKNLMFSFDSNKLKIIDFGRASQFGKPAEVNTVRYMAPEIANTTRAKATMTNEKIDAFSAGQVLHEWIFGRPLDWADINPLMSQPSGAYPSIMKMRERYAEYVQKTYDPREGVRQGAFAVPLSKVKDSNVVEVIGQLLHGDPLTRASAEDVMQLDFFNKIPSIQKIGDIVAKVKQTPPEPVDLDFDLGADLESAWKADSAP